MMRKFPEVSLLILFETVFQLRFCVALLWRDVIFIKIWYDGSPVEIVMNELRKNQKFHFDLQVPPTLLNSTYLHCL